MQRLEGPTRRRLEEQARVIKALAHPTRLFLVEELCREERCVCEDDVPGCDFVIRWSGD